MGQFSVIIYGAAGSVLTDIQHPDLRANLVTALDENAPIDRIDYPVRFTPFDKALAGLRTAKQRLDMLEVETPEYQLALAELEKAVQK
jgi:hypothetical protein